MDPRTVVAEALKLWSVQDVASTFVFVAEDVVYVLHFDEELAPFAGITHGREAMMDAFYRIIEEFDYLEYSPVIMSVEGEMVRVYTRHSYLHRRTGSVIAGSYRTIFTVRDGLIVRCEEFVDRGLVESFMRLTRQREAANEIVAPPQIPRLAPARRSLRPQRPALRARLKVLSK